MTGDLWRNYQALRTELSRHPLTSNFTVVSALPVNADGGGDVDFAGRNPDEKIFFTGIQVDENFIETFGLQLISGRGFYQNYKADTAGYLVNEAALKVMGMDASSAIGKHFSSGPDGKILGVVKDFHFKPLRQRIEPLVLSLNTRGGVVVVRTQPGHTEATIRELEQICRKLNPSFPFAYNFVEEDLAKLYQSEQRMSTIVNTFAMLSIFISCLGLYGLAAFTAEQRTREISIRKVLGASVSTLVSLISKDFLKLILIANLIAWPLAWWAMHTWLQDFAYQIDISLWIFIMAGGMVLFIALCTVGFQAVKVARSNPVSSLRNE
jgi:ABC-type antimicrobial peptide transport system permease subunit